MRTLPTNPSPSCNFDSLIGHVDSITKYVKQNKLLAAAVTLIAGAVFATAVYCAVRPNLKGRASMPPQDWDKPEEAHPLTPKGQNVPKPTAAGVGGGVKVTNPEEAHPQVVVFNRYVQALTTAMQQLKDFVRTTGVVGYFQDVQEQAAQFGTFNAQRLAYDYVQKGKPEKKKNIPALQTHLAKFLSHIKNLDDIAGLTASNTTNLLELVKYDEITSARTLIENGKKLANTCAHIIFVYYSKEQPFNQEYDTFPPPFKHEWDCTHQSYGHSINTTEGARYFEQCQRHAIQRCPLDISVFETEV